MEIDQTSAEDIARLVMALAGCMERLERIQSHPDMALPAPVATLCAMRRAKYAMSQLAKNPALPELGAKAPAPISRALRVARIYGTKPVRMTR